MLARDKTYPASTASPKDEFLRYYRVSAHTLRRLGRKLGKPDGPATHLRPRHYATMPFVVPTFIQTDLGSGTTPDDRESVRWPKPNSWGASHPASLQRSLGLVYLFYQEVAAAYIAFGFGSVDVSQRRVFRSHASQS